MREEVNSNNPQSSSYSYQVGGSLPLFAPSYVKRRADEELFKYLKSGEFCYVLNSRQMGKSSLRVQTMQRLQAEGIACSVIDITSIGTQQITPEQWYASLIGSLVSSFRLSINLRTWWREREHLSCIKRLSDFFETVLLTEVSQNIVIFIDEIDSVLGLKFPIDDFFAWIRSCYNKRAEQPAYRRLTFALLGVATPADLIADKNRTPFNIGKAIQLNGFELHETQPLAQGLEGKTNHPQQVLTEVLAWTGGQPFLTQKLCNLVVQEEATSIEQLVRKWVIENWESLDEPEHLKTIRDRLLRNEKRAGRLLGLYQQILQQGEIATDDSPEQMDLRLSGLVVKQTSRSKISSSVLRVYNPIYESVFNQDWVEKRLAELRPYNQAITAWLASNRTDNSRLLQGQALQEALNWKAGKSLSILDDEFLAACQQFAWEQKQKDLEAERAKEAEGRLAEQKKSARRQKLFLAAVSVGLVVSSLLGVAAFLQYRKAALSEIKAIAIVSRLLFASNQRFEALVEAIRAKQQLRKLGGADADTQSQVELLLQQAVYGVKEYNRLLGHETGVYGVSFSPDGQMLASASNDHTVKLWKPDGSLFNTLKGHSAEVYGIAFSPNGQILASASQDNTVKLWKRGGSLFKTLKGHSAVVWGVAFSPDGQMLASASWDNTVKLWKPDGTLLKTLQGHSDGVYRVVFSPDGQMLASASKDKSIKLWKRDGSLLKTLNGHEAAVIGIAFSPDGQMLASASNDKSIKLWKRDGTLLKTLKGHSAEVYGIGFSPDGQMLASASQDNTVRLWKRDGTLLTTLNGHSAGVYGVAFSPDGQTLASAGWDNTVRLWKQNTTLLTTLNGHSAGVWGVAFSPDGQMVASASEDKSIKLWKREGSLLKTLKGHSNWVWGVAFSPDSQILASAGWDNTVKLWKRDGTLLKTLKGHSSPVYGVAFSSGGQMLASASNDNTVKLWKRDGTLLKTLKGHSAAVYGVAFSPDGQMLASASNDNTVKLWKPDGTLLKTLKGHSAAVYGVAFSPDGQMLASVCEDKTIKLWKRDGTLLKTLKGHSDRVIGVVFSPDSQMIASASQDKTIKLWKRDGTLLKTLNGHSGRVYGVAFSPDGQMLTSVSQDNTVIMWNLKSILNLDPLVYGCNWVRDYLRTNAEVKESDRHLCDDIQGKAEIRASAVK
ncbi:AAA-like domain-containing protein [Floridanema evergladense]|uniref:AAA-like domain-containing protein n=1 Tax=Floridaenema evergladense BLCC-F167 TaxID=3153639 RepID=A0ABV4WNK5_9CYAN